MNVLTYLRLTAKQTAHKLGASEEGAVATEYVFLLVLIALAIFATVTVFGNTLNNAFQNGVNGLTGSGVTEGAGPTT